MSIILLSVVLGVVLPIVLHTFIASLVACLGIPLLVAVVLALALHPTPSGAGNFMVGFTALFLFVFYLVGHFGFHLS